MRRKTSFHFIHVIWTKSFNETHFHYIGRNVSVKSVDNDKKNISNYALYIVKFFIGVDTDFCRFQNETASLCFDNSVDKDLKRTFVVS